MDIDKYFEFQTKKRLPPFLCATLARLYAENNLNETNTKVKKILDDINENRIIIEKTTLKQLDEIIKKDRTALEELLVALEKFH